MITIISFISFFLISILIIHNFKIIKSLYKPYHYAENQANQLRYINYYFLTLGELIIQIVLIYYISKNYYKERRT